MGGIRELSDGLCFREPNCSFQLGRGPDRLLALKTTALSRPVDDATAGDGECGQVRMELGALFLAQGHDVRASRGLDGHKGLNCRQYVPCLLRFARTAFPR